MSSRSKVTKADRPFFVYGTLLPGQPNAYLWGDAIVSSQPATFHGGQLYDMGNYPMLIETGPFMDGFSIWTLRDIKASC